MAVLNCCLDFISNSLILPMALFHIFGKLCLGSVEVNLVRGRSQQNVFGRLLLSGFLCKLLVKKLLNDSGK